MDDIKIPTDEPDDSSMGVAQGGQIPLDLARKFLPSSLEDSYKTVGRDLKESSFEFGHLHSSKTLQSKTTGQLVNECIWMVNDIRHILTGYTRAEIKELESADRLNPDVFFLPEVNDQALEVIVHNLKECLNFKFLAAGHNVPHVDCIEVLSDILATLKEVTKGYRGSVSYIRYNNQDYRILEEILPLLQGYRHEILNYWNEISHEDCLVILNDILNLLRDYTEIEERGSKISSKDHYEKFCKMIHEIEDIRRKLNCLTTQRNLLIRTKKKTEKEEEAFNPFKKAEEWERKRSQVLKRIVEIEEKLKSLSKWMSIFKITIYSTGVLHTVTKYFCFTASENRNSSLMPLLLIGSLGLGTMLAEKFTNRRFKGLFELLAEDQVLLAPILQQYNNTNEVESGIENIFPFHITKNIVEEFSGNIKSYSMSGLLDILLEKRKYSGLDNEKTKIHYTFQNLALHPSFPWNWLFSEKSKDVFIIIAKIKLIYHDVQTENPVSENLNDMCFWGSLFLDGLSVIKEFDRLRSFECRKVCLMGMLKNHLTCEMLALKEIVMKS